jgi:serine/threonine-protein kinase RsbW/stage II sporulation protein AB (anti-sigma F factor)
VATERAAAHGSYNPHPKGAFVARERPTASDDQISVLPREVSRGTNSDVLTRAQARALSRCAPLRRGAHTEAVPVRTGQWGAPAHRDEIRELRRQVASFAARAGMSDDALAELQVAVSEALSNAVLHAYNDRDFGGDMRVDAEVDASELLVRVRDYGTGMAPRTDSPGMGLGLSIIARLCKRHSIRRCDGGGTEIGMCFDLAYEGQPA